MKIKTKENDGITLISLVLTIVIIMILVGVTTYTGFNTYDYSKVTKFVIQMQLLQTKANELVESNNEYNLGVLIENDSPNYLQATTIINEAYDNQEILSNNPTDFIYFSEENLKEQLDIEDAKGGVLINSSTREVVSLNGILYEGQVYYTQYLLPGGQKIIINQSTNSTLSFELDTDINGLNANVNIINIKRTIDGSEKAITKGIIKYKLLPDNNTEYNGYTEYNSATGDWKNVVNNNVNITISGRYVFALEDSIGTTPAVREVIIKLTNTPNLTGEITVKAKYDTQSHEVTTSMDEENKWYDYSQESSNWAYATDTQDVPNYYLWIPRFAYKTENSITTIKFLKGNSDIPTDNTTIEISQDSWIIPTQFSRNGHQLRGVWIKLTDTSNLSDINIITYLDNTLSTNIIPII